MKALKDLEDLFWKNTLQEHDVKNSCNKFYSETTKLSVPFDVPESRFEISDALKEKLNGHRSYCFDRKFDSNNLKTNNYSCFSYLESFEIWKSILNNKDTSLMIFFQQTPSEYAASIERIILKFKEYIDNKNLFIRRRRKLIFKIINQSNVDANELQKQANDSKVRAKIYQLLFNELLKKYNFIDEDLKMLNEIEKKIIFVCLRKKSIKLPSIIDKFYSWKYLLSINSHMKDLNLFSEKEFKKLIEIVYFFISEKMDSKTKQELVNDMKKCSSDYKRTYVRLKTILVEVKNYFDFVDQDIIRVRDIIEYVFNETFAYKLL